MATGVNEGLLRRRPTTEGGLAFGAGDRGCEGDARPGPTKMFSDGPIGAEPQRSCWILARGRSDRASVSEPGCNFSTAGIAAFHCFRPGHLGINATVPKQDAIPYTSCIIHVTAGSLNGVLTTNIRSRTGGLAKYFVVGPHVLVIQVSATPVFKRDCLSLQGRLIHPWDRNLKCASVTSQLTTYSVLFSGAGVFGNFALFKLE